MKIIYNGNVQLIHGGTLTIAHAEHLLRSQIDDLDPELIELQCSSFDELREIRDGELKNSDWTQMPDTPLTTEQKQAWADYRQALRDLPNSNDDPTLAVWPTAPQEQ
ncbi:hypothetical protein HG263_21575 [Pseudoalteromonas sp. JBTF-M23]|uniref:Phage tail assembly chaperone-like domain-containing protein n=1 Tax=Pseudoalteromonas caenipelagi TaxID=2726988 RepID=A0A849VN10_9GAMM|nr:tail fiber assembly protein [Pseudoalteromonas caenipelagi]NOU53094.1 hypothetical protein [Pseudoalteromonas caenipelagi]